MGSRFLGGLRGRDEALVSVSLKDLCKIGAPAFDDATIDENVHDIRGDVPKDSCVVGDEEGARTGGLPVAVHSLGDDPERIDVETGICFIENRELRPQQWRISWRFFSPPENPSFTLRSANAGSI